MRKIITIKKAIAALTVFFSSCNTGDQQRSGSEISSAQGSTVSQPKAEQWVKSPLRNQIILELRSPLKEVWMLIGDPSKMPSYSSGLLKVVSEVNGKDIVTKYTCYFKPVEGMPDVIHSSFMKWYVPNRGWASLDEEPNALGLEQSLTLITLEQEGQKTILKWSMHFNCSDPEILAMNISSLEQALNIEISQRLTERFGGRVIKSYVYGK